MAVSPNLIVNIDSAIIDTLERLLDTQFTKNLAVVDSVAIPKNLEAQVNLHAHRELIAKALEERYVRAGWMKADISLSTGDGCSSNPNIYTLKWRLEPPPIKVSKRRLEPEKLCLRKSLKN